MSELWAGWSKQEMRIPVGYPMAGYIAREGSSTGRLDSLFVRALALKQGRLSTGIVVADLLCISNRWAGSLRSRLARVLDTRGEHIIVAATHTHSGPQIDTRPFNFASVHEDKANEKLLMRSIGRCMERAMAQAKQSIEPVNVSVARISIRGVATDRNRRGRSKTQPLFLIRFENAANAALLGVSGCHSTVLGARNTLLSGDLNGAIARCLEEKVKVALMATGAAANISTRFTRRSQTPREVASLAAKVTRQAATARFQRLPQPILGVRSRTTRIRVSNLHNIPTATTRKTGRLEIVRGEGMEVRKRLARAPEFASGSIVAPLTMLGIGTLRVAALPFEIYSDTGEFLWSRRHVIPLCYANGYWGYVPSPAAGPEDYEAISSPFVREADSELRHAVVSMRKT